MLAVPALLHSKAGRLEGQRMPQTVPHDAVTHNCYGRKNRTLGEGSAEGYAVLYFSDCLVLVIVPVWN